MLMVMSLAFTACDDDDVNVSTVKFDELPLPAQNFLTQYYAGDQISTIFYNVNSTQSAYEVYFDSGSEVEFDKSGNWTEVNAPAGMSIPDGIAPVFVVSYVEANYPLAGVNSIDIEYGGVYDVELTNGVEIVFSANGDVLGVN